MKKSSKIILTIVIILIIAAVAGGVWLLFWNLKKSNDKINELQNQIVDLREVNKINNEESSNRSIENNNTKNESSSNEVTNTTSNNIKQNNNVQNNTSNVQNFSNSDLQINGISFGSSGEDVISKFGSNYTSKSYEEGASGDMITELNYENMGLVINLRTKEEDGVVDSMFLGKNSTVEITRGLNISSSRKEILDAFKPDSILKNDNDEIVVGFPGDTAEYSSKGRIYFKFESGKIVSIYIINTYGE